MDINGEIFPYDKLLIATGSAPKKPEIEGLISPSPELIKYEQGLKGVETIKGPAHHKAFSK